MRTDPAGQRAAFEDAAARLVRGEDPNRVLHAGYRLTRRDRRALRAVATIAAADRTLEVPDADAQEFAALLASRAVPLRLVEADAARKRWRLRVGGALRRFMLRPALAGAIVLTLGMGSTAVAAFHSSPTSPLYPVRRALERARLALTFADHARAQAHIDLAKQRLAEAEALARGGAQDRADSLTEDARAEIQAAKDTAASLDPEDAEEIEDQASSLEEEADDDSHHGGDEQDADDADDDDADHVDEPDAPDDSTSPDSSGSGSSGSSGSGSSGSGGSGSSDD